MDTTLHLLLLMVIMVITPRPQLLMSATFVIQELLSLVMLVTHLIIPMLLVMLHTRVFPALESTTDIN